MIIDIYELGEDRQALVTSFSDGTQSLAFRDRWGSWEAPFWSVRRTDDSVTLSAAQVQAAEAIEELRLA